MSASKYGKFLYPHGIDYYPFSSNKEKISQQVQHYYWYYASHKTFEKTFEKERYPDKPVGRTDQFHHLDLFSPCIYGKSYSIKDKDNGCKQKNDNNNKCYGPDYRSDGKKPPYIGLPIHNIIDALNIVSVLIQEPEGYKLYLFRII